MKRMAMITVNYAKVTDCEHSASSRNLRYWRNYYEVARIIAFKGEILYSDWLPGYTNLSFFALLYHYNIKRFEILAWWVR